MQLIDDDPLPALSIAQADRRSARSSRNPRSCAGSPSSR